MQFLLLLVDLRSGFFFVWIYELLIYMWDVNGDNLEGELEKGYVFIQIRSRDYAYNSK